MKKWFKYIPFFLLLLLASTVLAVGKPTYVGNPPPTVGQGFQNQQGRIPSQAQSHLTDAKLRACQAREQSIKTRSTHLLDLVNTMESKFDSIAKRVEDFYTSKVVPSGKTVPNYTTLVSDIQTKKQAVQTALTAAQTDASNFSCIGADPKAQLTQFRLDMQAVKKTLKEYRTSIKNLIVAVHLVTGETEKETPKPTK